MQLPKHTALEEEAGRQRPQSAKGSVFHGDFGPSALTPRETSNSGTSGTCLLPRDRFYGLTPSELSFFLFFFWPRCASYGILVHQPGIEPIPPAVEVGSLNDWTASEVPELFSLEPTVSPCEKAALAPPPP